VLRDSSQFLPRKTELGDNFRIGTIFQQLSLVSRAVNAQQAAEAQQAYWFLDVGEKNMGLPNGRIEAFYHFFPFFFGCALVVGQVERTR
jgi:hypothetical protein